MQKQWCFPEHDDFGFCPLYMLWLQALEKEMLGRVKVKEKSMRALNPELDLDFGCFTFLHSEHFDRLFLFRFVHPSALQDALLKAAMVCGFAPNVCLLYRGQRSPPPGSKQRGMWDFNSVWCRLADCDVFHYFFLSSGSTRKLDRKLDILFNIHNLL